MADVHPTAVILGEVDLAPDVSIGPGCVIDGTPGPVTIGAGTRMLGPAYLYGPLTMGQENAIYPFVCLGFAPQSVGFDHEQAGQGLRIGDHNRFREGVTIHRAMTDDGPTTIGDHTYFMTNAHAGHDTRVGDHCILASGALLGGHVIVHERVMIGGNTPVHQFCRIGRGAMLAGAVAATNDIPPFFMLTGINVIGAVNAIGMRRQNLPREQKEDIRWAYKTLYRSRLPVTEALEALKERADRPMVAEYIDFIETSRRGICPSHDQPKRSLQY
ncbi:MAG: acyl-ACP--UDP-N-acetylglucosamine O-acyltransferase [Planctomycetota bacterium]|jgi:UDP-N-acetylglucosamine acyltransferase